MNKNKTFLIIFIFFLLACSTQKAIILDNIPIEISERYEQKEIIYLESLNCREAIRVNKYRNAKIHERMDECMTEINDYIKCNHWIFGYIGEQ